MNKPSWDNAPEWANYLAMDEDGGWWWYKETPKAINGGVWDCLGLSEKESECVDGWEETLEARP